MLKHSTFMPKSINFPTIPIKPITKIDTVPTDKDLTFRYKGLTKLTDISVLSQFNGPTRLNGTFAFCQSLKDISPLKDWDTSKCSDFTCCFMNCSQLSDIKPLENWTVKGSVKYMFKGTSVKDFSPLQKWFPGKTIEDIVKMVC